MTAEEWHRLTKTTGMTMYFRLPNGKPVLGTAVGFIARGATLVVRELRKDGSEIQSETYWPYQCLYACPDGALPEWKPPGGRDPIQKRCKCCGELFQTENSHQKFCSKECQQRYFSNKPKKQIIRVCPVCGKTFTIPPKKKEQKYCSKQCAWEGISALYRD